MSEEDTEKKPAVGVCLRLNTLENARKSFARIMRAYSKKTIDEKQARCFAYLFEKYLSYLKFEAEEDIEARLVALEEKLAVVK